MFLSIGDRGEEARTGEEDSGDDTAGRWFQEPEKMGLGEKESILVGCVVFSCDMSYMDATSN